MRIAFDVSPLSHPRTGVGNYLRGPTPGGEGTEEHVTIGADGIVRHDDGRPLEDTDVVVDSGLDPDGRPLARDEGWGLTLYRVQPPLQSMTRITGLYDDGWSGPLVTYLRRRCQGGRLTVSLSGDPTLLGSQQTTVTARTGGVVVRSVTYAQDAPAALAVPLVSRDGRCVVRFTVSPTAVPAEVLEDSTDTRRLGTHFVGFTYER